MKFVLAIALAIAFSMIAMPVTVYAKTFTADGKYTAQYPSGCKTDKSENRFSDTLTLECKGDIGIQLENDEIFKDQLTGDTDEGALDMLETTADSMLDGIEVVEKGTDKYVINNQTAPYLVGTYTQTFTNFLGLPSDETEDWVIMVIAIKLGNGDYVVGQYRNTEDDFDKDLDVAEKVFQSVKAVEGAEAEVEPTGKKIKCFDNEKVEELGRLIGKEIDCA